MPVDLTTTGRIEDNRIVLNPGEMQYGPYIRLSAGSYEVEVLGDGLSGAVFSVTQDIGTKRLPFELVEQTDMHAIYRFELESDTGNAEFLTINNGAGTVMVDRIVLNNRTYVD